MIKPKILLSCILSGALAMSAPAQEQKTFTLGADISWYTELEAEGYSFLDAQWKTCSCPELIKSYGITAARFRVWVNPADGYNGKADVVRKAKEAQEQGLDIMIDFHFSDTWADPDHQTIPEGWNKYLLSKLRNDLTNHIKDVLDTLKNEGITPKWVQIGNETSDGFLWELGRATVHADNYKTLMSTAYDEVKKVLPNALVIVHLPNAADQGLYDWNLHLLNEKKFDIIGMSLYPGNDDEIEKAAQNIKHLWTEFGKECLVVEVGVPINDRSSIKRMRTILNKLLNETDNHCLGAFYWEPESFDGWNDYHMGASKADSQKRIKFTNVMDAFREVAEATAVETVTKEKQSTSSEKTYSLSGLSVSNPHKGVYIRGGKKYVVTTP